MEQKTNEQTNYDMEFDEYSQLESEAEALANEAATPQPKAPVYKQEQPHRVAMMGNRTNSPVVQTPVRRVMTGPTRTSTMGQLGVKERKQQREAEAELEALGEQATDESQVSEDEQLAEIDNSNNEVETTADNNQLSDEEELSQMQAVQNQKLPKWVPFHQPERIGIVNTETREIIEGFKDDGATAAMAKVLNEIDILIVGGGYQ